MNQAIELHDPTIAGLTRSGCDLTVLFDHVYLLRLRSDTDEGTGWSRTAEFTFANGIAHGSGDTADHLNWECATIETGWLFTPDDSSQYVIPAPLQIGRARLCSLHLAPRRVSRRRGLFGFTHLDR